MSLGNRDSMISLLLKEKWDNYLSPEFDAEINFRNVFKCIYYEKEMRERLEGNQDPERLSYGISLEEIGELFRKRGIDYSDEEMSLWLDRCVDAGVVVPIFIKKNGVWIRVYRFAEAIMSPDQFRYGVANSLEMLCDAYSQDRRVPHRGRGIPWILFEKFFVIWDASLKRNLVQLEKIETRKVFDRFGARLEIVDRGRRYTFRDWCEANSIVTRDAYGDAILSETFFRINTSDQNPIPPNVEPDLGAIVDLMFDVYAETKDWTRNYEVLLALTTCDKAEDYFEALKAELVLWLGHEQWNINIAISAFSKIAKNLVDGIDHTESASQAIDLLNHCDQCFAMSKDKQSSWNRRGTIKEELDHRYQHKPGFQHLYGKFLEHTIETTLKPQYSIPIKRIIYLSNVARCITSLCRTFLWDNDLVRPRPAGYSEHVQDFVKEYNSLLEEGNKLDILINLKHRLTSSSYDDKRLVFERLESLISEVKTICSEIDGNYRAFLEPTRPMLEELKEPRFVYSYDWRDSSQIVDKEWRKRVAWETSDLLVGFSKAFGDGELKPTFDDSNLVLFRGAENAPRCALSFLEEMHNRRITIRSSIVSNANLGPPYGKIEYEKLSGTYSGSVFEISARARDYFKERKEELAGESYIFMTEDVAKAFRNIAGQDKWSRVRDLGTVVLRGKLPTIRLYVYVERISE